mgnify:CR=1 FL=1
MVRSSSIIVKNQFANVNHHKGGSTPANFVANYTIRKDATEMIYPVSRAEFGSKSVNDTDSTFHQFIKATYKLDNSFLDNKRSQQINNQSLKMEGRCFDQDVISCSTERIYERLNDIEQAYESGGIDYVVKPFITIELITKANSYVRLKQLEDKFELLGDANE